MATAKGKQFNEEQTHTGLLKIDRYKWGIQDEPGNFKLIDKNELLVDHSYQREIAKQKTVVIASDWSWIACGAILVAHRPEGMYIIDGQHRVMAARKRSDITKLPCLVFPSVGIIKEAKAFLTVQTQRRPVNTHEKFNALLVIEDTAALMVKGLCDDYGITIAKGSSTPGTVGCVGRLIHHANTNPDILKRIWPLIVLTNQGSAIRETIAEGLMYIEIQLAKRNSSILGTTYADRAVKLGPDQLNAAALSFAQAFKKGGGSTWGAGILQAINKGLQNKLELGGVPAP